MDTPTLTSFRCRKQVPRGEVLSVASLAVSRYAVAVKEWPRSDTPDVDVTFYDALERGIMDVAGLLPTEDSWRIK